MPSFPHLDARTVHSHARQAAARWLWASAWARAAEDAGRANELGLRPGVNVNDVAPSPTPREAFVEADAVIAAFVRVNAEYVHESTADVHAPTAGFAELLERARRRDVAARSPHVARADERPWSVSFDPRAYVARFGELLAAEASGEGVAWTDDHADHGLTVPCLEPSATQEAAEADVASRSRCS